MPRGGKPRAHAGATTCRRHTDCHCKRMQKPHSVPLAPRVEPSLRVTMC